MTETVLGPDGQPLALAPIGGGDDFAAMQRKLAIDAQGEAPAPPRKDYGVKEDGTPKKAAGRPRTAAKADAARVQKEPAPAASSSGPARDYTQPLAELTEGAWFLMAQFPQTRAQAAILKAHRPALVSGWSLAAQNNRMIAAGVELLTGKATWVAAVAMASAPFVMQSLALWTRSDEQLAAAGMSTSEELAASTVRDLEKLAAEQEKDLALAIAVEQRYEAA